jgi:hypothetical protein
MSKTALFALEKQPLLRRLASPSKKSRRKKKTYKEISKEEIKHHVNVNY